MQTETAETWLARHGAGLIRCPHQPGNLMLSAASCAKRHACANSPKYGNQAGDSPHLLAFKMNLAPCRDCAIGACQRQHQQGRAA